MNKKVIIIGGGLAGLSAASLALQRGYRVEIYEKEPELGGNSQFETIEGFTFDILPKLYPAPYLLDSLLQQGDRSTLFSALFTQVFPTNLVLFADNKTMRFVSDVEQGNLPESLLTIPPLTGDAAYHKLEIVLQEILNRFSGKKPPVWDQLFNRKDILKLNLVQKISDYSSDPYFQQTLIALAATSGIPVQELEVRDLFMPALIRRSGLSIPRHGMKAVIDILVQYIKKQGAKIYTGAKVDELITEHKNVCGVRLSDQSQLWTDYILNTTEQLAPEEMRVKKNQPSMVLHLGLSELDTINRLNTINLLIINNNFRTWDTFKPIDHRWLPDFLYIQVPTLANPEMAPEHCSQLSIRFSIPKTDIDYRENELIRNNILTFLEEKYIPGLKQNIRMETIHMLFYQNSENILRHTPTYYSHTGTPSFLLQQNQRVVHLYQYYENRHPTMPIIIFAAQQWIDTLVKR
jgi:phytoene desaturase